MTKLLRWGMGASTALMALTLAMPGSAQTPPPTTPAPKVVPGPTTPPPVKAAPVTAPKVVPGSPAGSAAAAKGSTAATTKPPVKPKSACTKMADEAACRADTTCQFVAAQLVKDKTGAVVKGKDGKDQIKVKAYCRVTPPPPKPKAATAVKGSPAGSAAPVMAPKATTTTPPAGSTPAGSAPVVPPKK